MAWWDRLKDPFKGIPVVGGALDAVYDTLPIDNVIRMGEDIAKGDFGSAATNLGIGALETASFFLPGSQALKGAGGFSKLGARESAKVFAKGALKPGAVAGFKDVKLLPGAGRIANASKLTNWVGPSSWKATAAIAGGPEVVKAGIRAVKPAKVVAAGIPRTTSAASFRQLEESQKRAATPDSLERMAAYKKQRAASTPDALERMALYKRQQELLAAQKTSRNKNANKNKKSKKPQSDGSALTSGVYGGPGFEMSGLPNIDFSNIAIDPSTVVDISPTQDNPAEDKLAALTAEQQKQLMDSQQQLNSEYDALIAAFNKRDAEARQQEQQARGMAQNIAAGESQNLRTNLAAIGMEESPGPAIVGQESISAGSRAQQDAANLTLGSLISQIALEKQQAESRKKLQETELARMEREMRTQNTLAALLDAYKQAGEL